MRHLYRISAVLMGAILLYGLNGCAPKSQPISETRQLLGTDLTITVYDKNQTKEALQSAFNETFNLAQDLEARILLDGPENELNKLTSEAGEQSVPLSTPIFDLVMEALKLYEQTDKVFDIRVKPILDAYGFDKEPRVPTPTELDTLQQLVTEGGMFVAGKSILLAKKGMGFTLYKIGPGYILDKAAERLTNQGIQSATVQTNFLMRTVGNAPDVKGFLCKVADPTGAAESLGNVFLPVGGYAMVTCNEGVFEKDGKKYHMLLDPRTGKPAELCTAFAVHAKSAAEAQALALSAFILGPTDGLTLLDKFEGASGLAFFEENGKSVRKGTGPFEQLSTH
ncbi:FAD:protein FMN transferase [bacterium]|nr:FAD:protein FMN transferase [bacterium]MBU1936436.1 FAD:protein FMN transferase [bacterium]